MFSYPVANLSVAKLHIFITCLEFLDKGGTKLPVSPVTKNS